MDRDQLLDQVINHLSEWIEQAGPLGDALLINVLAQMVLDERKKTEYYKKCLEDYERKK